MKGMNNRQNKMPQLGLLKYVNSKVKSKKVKLQAKPWQKHT